MPEIEERTKYWRDQVDVLLKSGAALIVLFAGWALGHHKDFDLGSECPDRVLAAIGLLVMSLAYAIFLFLSVWKIYQHPLASSAESTLLSRKTALWLSGLLAAGGLAIAVLMSVR